MSGGFGVANFPQGRAFLSDNEKSEFCSGQNYAELVMRAPADFVLSVAVCLPTACYSVARMVWLLGL